ncbi:MAG: hypothetical protein DRJ03_19820 [Chloroflexi bacterium]|nr:MAG: hypothetical protein DRJ03_19820 [Chloroflexota bacterium]
MAAEKKINILGEERYIAVPPEGRIVVLRDAVVPSILIDSEGAQVNVISDTPVEEQVFSDEEIRDANAHNSNIADMSRYLYRTVRVINTLDKDVEINIKQNRESSITGAQGTGVTFSVGALTGNESRFLSPETCGWEPYVYIEATAKGVPTLGVLNTYITGRN